MSQTIANRLVCNYPMTSSWTDFSAEYNSEFSFNWIACHIIVKESILSYYLLIGGRKRDWFVFFLGALTRKSSAISFVQDLDSGRCIHFLRG